MTPESDWGRRDRAWAGIRSTTLQVAGRPVHALRADGDPSGPLQLLVHGLGGAAVNWLDVIGGLRKHGPVLAPDLPGFGLTPLPRPNASRVAGNLAFLAAVVRQLDEPAVTVHANSMGGLLATLLVARTPERVGRLVLVNPALPGVADRPAELDRDTVRLFLPFLVPVLGERLVASLYRRRSAEELVDANARLVHADPGRIRPVLRAVHVDNAAFGQRASWRRSGFAAAASSTLWHLLLRRRPIEALRRLAVPTLVVWGGQDRLLGPGVLDVVRAHRPDLPVRVLAGVGHAAMMEAPARYLDAVEPVAP